MTWLIQTTVYLTVTALFILFFKKVFKNRLPAKWHVYIWALLMIRLFVPYLPESRVSVYNALPAVEYSRPLVHTTASDIIQTDIAASDAVNNRSAVEADIPAKKSTAAAPKVSANEIIQAVYFAGAGLLLWWFILTYMLHLRKIKKYGPVTEPEILDLLRERKNRLGTGRNVILLSGGDTPCLVGFIRPKMILPDGYTLEETRYVLTHELCHLENGDTVILWLAMLVLCLNWFNPVLWYSFFILRRDIEVYCDSRVLELGEDKKEYAGLLLRMALKRNRFVFGTTSLQNGEKEVERRIKYMAYFKKPKLIVSAVILLIAAAVSVICLTNAKEKEPPAAPNTVAAVKEHCYVHLDEIPFDSLATVIYDLNEGDLLQVIEDAGEWSYVQLPIMDLPPVCGFVPSEFLTYDRKAIDSANHGRLNGAKVYNSPDIKDIYSAKESGIIYINYYSGDFANCDLIGGTNDVWVLRSDISRDITTDDLLYAKTWLFLNREFCRVFSDDYGIADLQISNWEQGSGEATFNYTVTTYNNVDLETEEWLQQVRATSSPEDYQRLVDDYFLPHESSYSFKSVLKNDKIQLYRDYMGDWQPVKIDDLTISEGTYNGSVGYIRPENSANIIEAVAAELKSKGWNDIEVDEGFIDEKITEQTSSILSRTDDEKDMNVYFVSGQAKKYFFNPLFVYVEIAYDDEPSEGEIYRVFYSSSSGRDLNAQPWQMYSTVGADEIMSVDDQRLVRYMYSY